MARFIEIYEYIPLSSLVTDDRRAALIRNGYKEYSLSVTETEKQMIQPPVEGWYRMPPGLSSATSGIIEQLPIRVSGVRIDEGCYGMGGLGLTSLILADGRKLVCTLYASDNNISIVPSHIPKGAPGLLPLTPENIEKHLVNKKLRQIIYNGQSAITFVFEDSTLMRLDLSTWHPSTESGMARVWRVCDGAAHIWDSPLP